jgi:hypothetical protein
MIAYLLSLFIKKPKEPEPVKEKPRPIYSTFSTDDMAYQREQKLEELTETNFSSVQKFVADKGNVTFAQDNQLNIKASFAGNTILPTAQVLWYAQQTFIGYQLCAMLAQQWLIAKCCLMPAKDAVRNGYELAVDDGTKVEPEVLEAIKKKDTDYQLNKNLIEFVQMGRIFGIRVVMFIVESNDEDYYKNPFNPDGVLPGSYKGISQIDPYWITPQLDDQAAGNPASIHFYEPTWWIINGKPVHRTHLVIFRTEEVADILKPTYIFGGIPIPQKICERVYASERTANEAPMLALTKRTDVIKMDLTQAAANPTATVKRLQEFTNYRDNFGVKTLGLDDEMMQFDTSLTDLDAVIMTQYQLVAAAANVPSVKLLGTPPKGFNATGEFEEANYHEELEGIQAHDLTPFIARHHLLLVRSEIAPEFGIQPFTLKITWNELDAMTTEEQAELNKRKAETGQLLITSGAIDGEEERNRLMTDPKSGYTGLEELAPDELEIPNDITGA